MRKIFIAGIFSALLFFSPAPFQNVSGQTEKINQNEPTGDEDGFYAAKILESDYRQADVVAYVNVKERKLVDSIGTGKADCENDKGTGYCLYLLKAELKEIYKGKSSTTEIEFYTSPDADYPKEKLMGERVVFLNRGTSGDKKKKQLHTIENSTRWIEHEVLEKMRKIARKKR